MKYLPYKIVALITLCGAFVLGMALESGASFIKDRAYKQAKIEVLLQLPVNALTSLSVEWKGRSI